MDVRQNTQLKDDWYTMLYWSDKWFIEKSILLEVIVYDMDVEWVYENDWVITFVWHPVMIGSVFERYSASKWFINAQFVIELVDKWTWYDRPIEEQSDECVNFVYSLIKK